jgi:hypothetical protein
VRERLSGAAGGVPFRCLTWWWRGPRPPAQQRATRQGQRQGAWPNNNQGGPCQTARPGARESGIPTDSGEWPKA